ncbi:hypothetical protein J5226_05720 [Lysobacter sp. K5869]|uniref:hypothetical protein n=1 Tax=Lysobacter sp. K5869 TaxID=2820808 RepID=UPI001C061E94|nr:hypothetical protein [Lysobacter sp. K5869]QWP77904.1 hypothetical protein J5226_05720 [Lysobacter sp. K5869]
MDGTPDTTARRRAFRRWLFAYPLATLAFTVYFAATQARTDMGEFLLLIVVAIGAALAIPVLALIDGARARAIGAAVGGCLLGIAPALLVFAGVLEADRAYSDHQTDKERQRAAALADAAARGDADAVRAAMAKLSAEYGPGRALCFVGGRGRNEHLRGGSDGEGSDDWLLSEPEAGAQRVSTARLFDAAEALIQGRPRAQQQVVLASLLVRLSERDESLSYLPGWLRLWRGTDPAARQLTFAQPRDDQASGDCYLPEGNVDLARIVADTWHDDGLRAWIAAGYGFAPEQGSVALDGLRGKAGLDALTAAGFDLGAALRRTGYGDDVMFRLVSHLPQRLDDSGDPAALADLIDAYLRAGAELGRTTYGETLCDTFVEGERKQANIRNAAPASAREAAARRIHLALCPQGQPPAPTSSSTSAHENRLEAAARAAAQEAVDAARAAPERPAPTP